jgi:hypothetical protein
MTLREEPSSMKRLRNRYDIDAVYQWIIRPSRFDIIGFSRQRFGKYTLPAEFKKQLPAVRSEIFEICLY